MAKDAINVFSTLAMLVIIVANAGAFSQVVRESSGAVGGLFNSVARGR